MKAIVCGAGGFIGSHLVKRLKDEGYYVVGVDRKEKPMYWDSCADLYYHADLCTDKAWEFLRKECGDADEIYQLAADMGGLGFVGTGLNDTVIMANSGLVNLQCVKHCTRVDVPPKVFFSSSSCVYPRSNQMDPNRIVINEASVYPAFCDNNYGWEKLFSERMYIALMENYGIKVRIARLHNCYGPYETYKGGREKCPAATCVKIASIKGNKGTVTIWGHGNFLRTYMWIGDCLEGIRRMMNAEYFGPANLGSDEKISANELAYLVARIAGKEITLKHTMEDETKFPMGVPARTSDNRLIQKHLGWSPATPLLQGMTDMYRWVKERVHEDKKSNPKT